MYQMGGSHMIDRKDTQLYSIMYVNGGKKSIMKKISLCLMIIIGLFTIAGCSNNNKEAKKETESYNSIVISDVDKDTRWEAITKFDITLEFEDGKCVSENYRLEFQKESNAIVYGMEMESKTYIEDYEQKENVVTYKRTGMNNEFYDNTLDEAYDNAKILYSSATITKCQ